MLRDARICRWTAICALPALMLVAGAAPALGYQEGGKTHGVPGAAAIEQPFSPRRDHSFYGIVPSARAAGRTSGRPTAGEFAASSLASGNNVKYWGGPIMPTNTTYAIYWMGPSGSVSTDYESIINGFFTNLAAAQNVATDVYAVGTQYYGPAGTYVENASTVGGVYVDITTPIPDDCSAEYDQTGVDTSGGCVTDADIQAEVSQVAKANGWTAGPDSIFFVFTPQNVGSCFDSSSNQCAYTYYCAYHSNYTDSTLGEVLYANLPYSENDGAPGACDSGEYPNGDPAADSTINLISHEHNETITDPLGNAWYDSAGNEIGDKCAWDFGNGPLQSTGKASSSEYNQQIGSGYYYVQQEWSNASSACALGYAPAAPTITGFSPSSARAGSTVTIRGSGFTSTSTVAFNGVPSTHVVFHSSSQLTATVPSAATSGPITVTNGSTSVTSTTSFKVLPTITGFTPSSGPVGKSVVIGGSGFAGATRVTFDGVSATFTVASSNSISTSVPSGARSGRVVVTTPAGTATSSSSFSVTSATRR